MYKGVHSKAARVIKGEEKNQVRNRSEFPQKGALVLTVGGRRMAYLNTSGINMGCLWLLVHVCYLHVSVLPNICSLSLQVKLTKTIVDYSKQRDVSICFWSNRLSKSNKGSLEKHASTHISAEKRTYANNSLQCPAEMNTSSSKTAIFTQIMTTRANYRLI